MVDKSNIKRITVIPSKSDAHRAFICAGLAEICATNALEAIDTPSSRETFTRELSPSSWETTPQQLSPSGRETSPRQLSPSSRETSLRQLPPDSAARQGKCNVICNETSVDIEATKQCMTAIVESLEKHDSTRTGVDLYCKESGSTLRFLLPVVGALGIRGIFHPMGRLSKRPLSPLYEELCAHGMKISTPGSVPLIAEGKLRGGDFFIPGDISSQFVSGLLFALPLLEEDSRILVRGEFQSAAYVDMTLSTLSKFGIKVHEESGQDLGTNLDGVSSLGQGAKDDTESGPGVSTDDITRVYRVPGKQKYALVKSQESESQGTSDNTYTAVNVDSNISGSQQTDTYSTSNNNYEVEGDWSNAAFWFAAGLLGEVPIEICGLDINSVQGDKAIVDVIRRFGGEVIINDVKNAGEPDADIDRTAGAPDANVGQTADNCSDAAVDTSAARGMNSVIVMPSAGNLKGVDFDAGQTPDMIPVVALIATQAKGITNIKNAARLRIKESDRLHSICVTLRALGADIDELPDGLRIRGNNGQGLKGATVESFDDHRIAMMTAVASLLCGRAAGSGATAANGQQSALAENQSPKSTDNREGTSISENDSKVTLIGWEAVNKSYPLFFEKLKELGLDVNLETL